MDRDLDPKVRLLVRTLKVMFQHIPSRNIEQLREIARNVIEVFHAEGMPVKDAASSWAIGLKLGEDPFYEDVASHVAVAARDAQLDK